MAVGAPRWILVGDQPHDKVLARKTRIAVAEVETQALLHRDRRGVVTVAQALVETLRHAAPQWMVDGHDNLRQFVETPVGAVLPTAEMGRHCDPVAAVDPGAVLLEPLHGEDPAPLAGSHVGHIDRIDEHLGKRAVETPADPRQLFLALLGKGVVQIHPHHLPAITDAVAQQEIDQILDDIVLEPIGQDGEQPCPQPEYLQPDSLYEIEFRALHDGDRLCQDSVPAPQLSASAASGRACRGLGLPATTITNSPLGSVVRK